MNNSYNLRAAGESEFTEGEILTQEIFEENLTS